MQVDLYKMAVKRWLLLLLLFSALITNRVSNSLKYFYYEICSFIFVVTKLPSCHVCLCVMYVSPGI